MICPVDCPGFIILTGQRQPLGNFSFKAWSGRDAEMCETRQALDLYLANSEHVPFNGLAPSIWISLSDARNQKVDDVNILIAAFNRIK